MRLFLSLSTTAFSIFALVFLSAFTIFFFDFFPILVAFFTLWPTLLCVRLS